MNSFIIISTPAGGKGVVSEYIKNNYDFIHISTGDLLRKEVSKNSEIGKKVKNYLENGLLVDDDILFEVLSHELKNIKKDYILDGTPRELHQALIYDSLLKKLNINLTKVIYIKVDKEVAISRMLDRVVCTNCNISYSLKENGDKCKNCHKKLVKRNDDNINTFNKRYETYQKLTYPLIEYYEKQGKLVVIDNNSTIEHLYDQIDKVIKEG